jgi:histidinol phosphatase-like enzyme (inositol monophosphatase family)
MNHEELAGHLAFAESLAKRAGEITMKYFRTGLSVEYKSDESPVTIADRETEKFIRSEICAKFPDHGIMGEEFGGSNSDSPYQWTIDPIDGTKSFIRGIPLYTVLIALLYKGEPCLGVIHNPPLNETAAAATGLGCRYNGSTCRVSQTRSLSSAYVQTSDAASLARGFPELTQALLYRALAFRTWGDAYGYLLVATGRSDVMIDPQMHIWDIGPLKTIITEAGGAFSDLSGNISGLGANSVASNGLLHKEVLGLV